VDRELQIQWLRARIGSLMGIDVRVCINPNDAGVGVSPGHPVTTHEVMNGASRNLRQRPRNGAHGKGMVSAKREG
jgi:hypothetical protein